MIFNHEVNGINVEATFSDKSVKDIFIPLLKKLTEIQKSKGSRILVMVAAPPAVGKTTLLAFLKYLSETTKDVTPISTIGMDGFHRYQDYLISHTLVRDGKEVKMVDVKGCPETFDLDKLIKAVKIVSEGKNFKWPDYSRKLHNPIENAIDVSGDIVLLEGNYLLLNTEEWSSLRKYSDVTIKITAEEDKIRERLINRKVASGTEYKKAVEFVDRSDMYNVKICLEKTMDADINIYMVGDGEFEMK